MRRSAFLLALLCVAILTPQTLAAVGEGTEDLSAGQLVALVLGTVTSLVAAMARHRFSFEMKRDSRAFRFVLVVSTRQSSRKR